MDGLLTSYETIYIIKPNLSEDNLLKIIENYQGLLIERGAKNIVTQNRGRRGLKYLINKFKDGSLYTNELRSQWRGDRIL